MLTKAASIKAANAPNKPIGKTSARTRGALSWVFKVSELIFSRFIFTESEINLKSG